MMTLAMAGAGYWIGWAIAGGMLAGALWYSARGGR